MQFEVGQEVAVDMGYGGYSRYVAGVVERVTPSGQVVARFGSRVARFDRFGREQTKASRRDKLCPLDATIRAAIRRDELVSQFKYTKWADLPLETLEAVAAALD